MTEFWFYGTPQYPFSLWLALTAPIGFHGDSRGCVLFEGTCFLWFEKGNSRCKHIGVLFGCFGKIIDGPGLSGGLL